MYEERRAAQDACCSARWFLGRGVLIRRRSMADGVLVGDGVLVEKDLLSRGGYLLRCRANSVATTPMHGTEC